MPRALRHHHQKHTIQQFGYKKWLSKIEAQRKLPYNCVTAIRRLKIWSHLRDSNSRLRYETVALPTELRCLEKERYTRRCADCQAGAPLSPIRRIERDAKDPTRTCNSNK